MTVLAQVRHRRAPHQLVTAQAVRWVHVADRQDSHWLPYSRVVAIGEVSADPTADTESIGEPDSHDCLRVTAADANWLIRHVPGQELR